MVASSKKNKASRFLSLLLAVVMAFTMIPAGVLTSLAAGTEPFAIVVDDGVAPVEGATVKVLIGETIAEEATTDENGRAEFTLENRDDYEYSVEKLGYNTEKGAVVVADGEIQVTLTAKSTCVVNGTVKDAEGNALAGAAIEITGYNKYSAVSDETGAFSVADVYEGEQYTLTATLAGYKTVEQSLALDAENAIVMELKGAEELTFGSADVTLKYGESLTNTANSASGPADEYISDNEGIVKVDKNGTITPTGTGSTTITAKRYETADYVASEAVCTVTVNKGDQAELTWENSIPANLTWKDSFANKVGGGTGDGAVTYASSKDEVATVDNNGVLTINKPGTVKITATKAGGDFYEDITAEYEITFKKADQAPITFVNGEHPDAIYFGEIFANEAKGGSVTGTFVYESSDTDVAEVNADGSLVVKRATKDGESITITATLAGNDYYNDVTASYTLTIYRADQAGFLFSKGSADQTIKYGEDFDNIASGGKNSPITYKSSDETVAKVDNNGKITTFKQGETTITATVPADDRYNSKEISYKLIVECADQTVNFTETEKIPAITFGNSYQNAATAKTNITYSTSDKTVAEVDTNGNLIIHKAGSVTITATAEQTDQYNKASAEYTIQINKAQPVIKFEKGTTPSVTFNDNGNVFINTATNDTDLNAYTYSIASGAEFVDGDIDPVTGEFKIKGVGEIEIKAYLAGDERYAEATEKYTLTVVKANQTIGFDKTAYEIFNGDEFTAPEAKVTSANFGTGEITYSIKSDDNNIIKTLDANTGAVEFTFETGTAVIVATKAADGNYNEATAEYTLTIVDGNVSKDKYIISGPSKNDSGWFTGNVSIKAQPGCLVSYERNFAKADWKSSLANAATAESDNNVVSFFVKDVNGRISKQFTETIKKDSEVPEVKIKDETDTIWDKLFWDKLLTIVTFGLWGNDKTAEFTIDGSDETSGVASVEYYVDNGNTTVKSREELNQIFDWTSYVDGTPISVKADSKFVVYAKVTDFAGNYVYASTNGVVFDETAPTAKFDVLTKPVESNLYKGDVTVKVSVADAAPYSGIKSVDYVVTSNGDETQSGNLYTFDKENKYKGNPAYENLVPNWDTEQDNKNIVIDSVKNDSDNVVLSVTVTDNAGNTTTEELALSISANDPTIDVTFVDGLNFAADEDGVKYYNGQRRAKVVVTGRTSIFDKQNVKIAITQEKGDATAENLTYTISDWVTVDPTDEELAAGKTIDDATHTAYIDFNGSAVYTEFTVNYTDNATHSAKEYSADKFAVDCDAPTGEVTVGTSVWSELAEKLTFGLFTNTEVKVSVEANDATSRVKTIEYYKSNSTDELALDATALSQLDAGVWTDKCDSISTEEVATIYVKITDIVGNVTYVRSEGVIFDSTEAEVTFAPEAPNGEGYYNDDFTVDFSVEDKSPYAGIKSIEYAVTSNDETTQSDTLYTFDIEKPTYKEITRNWDTAENSKTITINADANNSDNVKLTVTVTDNAGNVSTAEQVYNVNSTAPTVELSYDNNKADSVVDNRGYFGEERTATVTITDRASTFDPEAATNSIEIVAKNAKGEIIASPATISEWKPLEGDTHSATINFVGDANYELTLNAYKNKADMSNTTEDGKVVVNTGDSVTPYAFTVDMTNPTGTVTVDSNTWNKLLDVLTFGLWVKSEKIEISATSDDVTSPTKIEYVVIESKDSVVQKTAEELDEITTWNSYDENKSYSVSKECQFAVYLKITDAAGNYTYINSDGFTIDRTESEVSYEIQEEPVAFHEYQDGNNIIKQDVYNGDVHIKFNINEKPDEDSIYSGFRSFEYKVISNGNVTQNEVYPFQKINPEFDDLISEFEQEITVDAKANSSCDVQVYAKVTDNAGNVTEIGPIKLDIDAVAPVIDVTYAPDAPNKTEDGRGYYSSTRTAEVTITERTAHFNADDLVNDITINAVNANGKVVADKKDLIGDWSHNEGNAPDEATHKLSINYNVNANYTFAIAYTDFAKNENNGVNVNESENPYFFTVDTVEPEGELRADKFDDVWTTLLEKLTFGLWSKETVTVSGKSKDITSPIESVSYIKTSSIEKLDLSKTPEDAWTELDITDFSKFDVTTITKNERATVYLRIVDFAGNIEYISTNGIIVDDEQPIIEEIKPEITITPEQPVNGFYNTDVDVDIKVNDPIVGSEEDGVYSGLNEVKCEILNMGKETQEYTLYKLDENADPEHKDLVQHLEKTIVVDKDLNNSNDVVIKVTAIDNAGNESVAYESIKIDVTNPSIDVTYDNNDGDTTFADGTYFKANRKATIVISERNFNPEKVIVNVTNEHGVVPTLLGWETVEAGGNGDKTTHTATISYAADGDYTFDISYVDEAGNENNAVYYGESLAPTKFTVDKTLPTVNIVYDNNDVLNGNYYKAERTATITVTEHNFETSRVNIALKATDNGQPSALPAVSNWTSNGDVHTATIHYAADSLYTFDFDYQDKARNATSNIEEQSFYVDKTNPAVSISKIVDRSANNDEGNIGFVITATDTNFDVFTPVVTAVVKSGNSFETKQVNIGAMSDIANGKTYTVENIDLDGIYSVKCTVIDKAGNAFSEVTLYRADGSSYVENRSGDDSLVVFSVNRDGSTFTLDKNTSDLVEKYYVQNVTNDVVVFETNADPLNEYKVTLNDRELTENVDYKVTQNGGDGNWLTYTYTIYKSLFKDEGEYKVVVSSKDKANNDAFSDVKNATVNFVVDRTAPVVTVSGLATDGRYQTEKQIVTVIPTDDGGALRSILVRTVDENGKAIKELINLSGEDLEMALESGSGKLTFEIAEGLYQNVQIICNDCAVDENGGTNTYDETFTNISVSSNAFMIFWANKPLRWGSIASVIALAIIIILIIVLKKRKKDEEENTKANK